MLFSLQALTDKIAERHIVFGDQNSHVQKLGKKYLKIRTYKSNVFMQKTLVNELKRLMLIFSGSQSLMAVNSKKNALTPNVGARGESHSGRQSASDSAFAL
jgi:hypothetical protein